MAKYRVQGIETEAGVAADDIVKAESPVEAAERALRKDAVRASRITELETPEDRANYEPLAPNEMSPNELVDKSSPGLKPRVFGGWVLLLVAVPVALSATLLLDMVVPLTDAGIVIVSIAAAAALLLAGALAFRPFWRR